MSEDEKHWRRMAPSLRKIEQKAMDYYGGDMSRDIWYALLSIFKLDLI